MSTPRALASRSGRNLINNGPELEADISYCARESVLTVVPRFVGMHGVAVLSAPRDAARDETVVVHPDVNWGHSW